MVDESSIFFVIIVDDKNLPLLVVVVAVFFFFLPAVIDSFPSSIFSHHESNKARHMVVLPIPARPATIMFNETIRGLSFNDSGDPIEFVLVVNVDLFSVVVLVGIFEDSNDDDSSGEPIESVVIVVDFVDIIVGDDDEATTTPTLRHRRPNKKINMDSEIIL